MKNQNDENLEQMLEKFLGAEEAQKAAREIEQGEKLFTLHPAPEPDESLIAGIKARISERLSKPRAPVYAASAYKIAAVAATILVWSWVTLQFFEPNRPERFDRPELTAEGPGVERVAVVERTSAEFSRTSPRRTWSGWDETVQDAEFASLAEEIDQLEGSILALRLGEEDSANGAILDDIEVEMLEIDNFFWKG